jgi:glycerol-3-phosphate acyltransferase PlsX
MSAVRVAVDAMGGDRAPEEIVAGVHAPDVVAMDEKPADAARSKRQSSLFATCRAVANAEADVALSAGNTGALLAAALLEIGRLRGVHRPAIAIPLPSFRGPSILIDGGANADARPEHLVQFAHMGAVFAEEVLAIRNPGIALLSIGEEAEKGNRLVREAHDLFAATNLHFVGNVESRELLAGAADVVVCDGFTGNITLKALEGAVDTTLAELRGEIASTLRGKLGGLLIRPAARALRARLNPDTYGGAYLLGLRGLVMSAHGNSSRTAIENAIRLAARGVEGRVVERVSTHVVEEPATARS